MNLTSIEVSVILLTYNPEWVKIKRTLRSITEQKNVIFEIIISDDGSKGDCFDRIRSFLNDSGTENNDKIKFVKNVQNIGTVKNCLGALEQANGKYIFLISPGDCLTDNHALSRFLNFSIQNNAKIVFGNAVFYNYDAANKTLFIFNKRAPICPENYSIGKDIKTQKESFLFGDYILGPTYFREKELFERYLKLASTNCKYVEDTTTTLFALYDTIKVAYYDSPIAFYEYGTGITTEKTKQWKSILHKEIFDVYYQIYRKSKDGLSRDALIYYMCNLLSESISMRLIKLIIFVRHPRKLFNRIKKIFFNGKYQKINTELSAELVRILDEKDNDMNIIFKNK